ncbi:MULTISPECIES: lasso peptide biosynthesis B2 protein [unclassified Streptomyces]|uniref:lasso peptide biosynthesis B2 protein n=1 Tax=unclassified Streptomyces TaxID=2593676 RepID=UPI001FAEAC95|nr:MULTISPECIES: lasso peptide biosynthesis B2 protein [unclassified Streptomyces]MCJ0873275.1 lasso peptide biosynthesis B2 protein [Streptomyces sp. AP-93]MCP3759117.1 lasso peptide biosynthesis B2 protein [Streptomyces sp. TBY4]
MSFHPVPETHTGTSFAQRAGARLAVAVGRPLLLLPPARLARVLGVVSRGARPAGHERTYRARQAVTTVSAVCAGREGCLPRSVATALLCRARGEWPTWCVGVRAAPPFGAHAWVEAEGRLVGEELPESYFRRLITVGSGSEERSPS